MRIRLGSKIFVIDILDLDKTVIGLNSNSFTDDDRHIFMCDLDDVEQGEAHKEARRLIKKFNLPHMMVFRSSENHFHLYSLTPLTFDELVEITFDSRTDYNHKMCMLNNGYTTLRVTPKKQKEGSVEFLGEIKNEDAEREVLEGGKDALMEMIENG